MYWGQTKHLTLAVILLLLTVSEAQSLVAQSNVDHGIHAMKMKKFATAYNYFTAAATENTKDAKAVFYQGVAANRLGLFQRALGYINLSRDLGGRHPDMAFEMGWASMRLGYHQDAVKYLKLYLESNDKRAQAHEFLGRAYLGTGQFSKAEKSLSKALKLNPKLAPSVEIARALIAKEKGAQAAAYDKVVEIKDENSEHPLARKVAKKFSNRVDEAFQQETAKKWRAQIETEFGYNDNVIASGDEVPLPTDISGAGGFFGRITAQASVDVYKAQKDLVTVGGMYSWDIYGAQFSAAQLHAINGYAEYLRQLSDRAKASLFVSGEYLNVGVGDFRSQISFSPAYIYAINENIEGEFSYTYNADEYHVAPLTRTDRDGHGHTFAADFRFSVPETELKGNVGVFAGHYNTDGSDFDRTSWGFTLGVSHPLPGNALIKADYTHIFDYYQNPNLFTGADREDGTDVFSTELSKKLAFEPIKGSETRVFVRYNFTHNNSNVPAYKYNQHVISMGSSLSF